MRPPPDLSQQPGGGSHLTVRVLQDKASSAQVDADANEDEDNPQPSGRRHDIMTAPIDYEQLVNAIGDAVVISDASGAITLWNPAAERMFGFTRAEALGQSLDLIIPERLRGRHWDGYHKTMATGETRYGHDLLKVPAVDKAGRAMSIAFTVALLRSPQGELTGIVAIIRDETSRFAEDRALRRRVTELEARLA
jgi:PAS domain S-box-containing protein